MQLSATALCRNAKLGLQVSETNVYLILRAIPKICL